MEKKRCKGPANNIYNRPKAQRNPSSFNLSKALKSRAKVIQLCHFPPQELKSRVNPPVWSDLARMNLASKPLVAKPPKMQGFVLQRWPLFPVLGMRLLTT